METEEVVATKKLVAIKIKKNTASRVRKEVVKRSAYFIVKYYTMHP